MPLFKKEEEKPTFEPLTKREIFKEQLKDFLWETIKVIVISIVIILPIRYFLIQPFYVKGASMEPNFFDHEYLIIDEISYRLNEPRRGDVVVFRYPNDPSQFFIKRVVGLPNETINFKDGGVIIINEQHPKGISLNENDYLGDMETYGGTETKIGEKQYFVMGDNRASSLDSRIFGAIDEQMIIGRAWLRGWPVSRAEVFETPAYDFNSER